MALNVVLVSQRQSPKGMALTWSPMEGVSSYQIFVATKKLSPEELEAAQLLEGTDECVVGYVSAEVHSLVDDVTPQGETRFYAVAMVFEDGAVKAARFKATPDGASAESFQLSASHGRAAAKPVVSRPSTEPPPPPASVPLAEPLELRMLGATQTWDGLRIHWEREPRAAAYEIVASDHQIFGDEMAEALSGNADFTTAVAVAPAVTCVIDNVTAREARGWYAVLARFRDGRRAVHPFQVGDAAQSGKTVAPFLNPNRTGELRGEVEDLLGQAQEQLDRWSAEQDKGARREAKRLVGDALLIWPNHPAAKKLSEQMA